MKNLIFSKNLRDSPPLENSNFQMGQPAVPTDVTEKMLKNLGKCWKFYLFYSIPPPVHRGGEGREVDSFIRDIGVKKEKSHLWWTKHNIPGVFQNSIPEFLMVFQIGTFTKTSYMRKKSNNWFKNNNWHYII